MSVQGRAGRFGSCGLLSPFPGREQAGAFTARTVKRPPSLSRALQPLANIAIVLPVIQMTWKSGSSLLPNEISKRSKYTTNMHLLPSAQRGLTMVMLSNVTVTYPNGITALHPTDLTFEKGKFTVLLGPSGAGKSTLLRTLNGLVRPTEGHVESRDLGPILASAKIIRKHRLFTGMIFQQHHLIGRLTVLANVLMGRIGIRGAGRSFLPAPKEEKIIALNALERLGLLPRALERADMLSGGQQQRVGIARAMAQQPHIILADEPVASLDPSTAERVLSDLHRICREDGITAIVSLHQVDFARRFADRIVGLHQGHVVFDGNANQLTPAIISKIYEAPQPLAAEAAE